jgi:DNA-binding HxlR family transcriptional regulator
MFAILGERWNYHIFREVFFGTNRFGGLQRALHIAPNVLTNRLNTLVELDLLERHQYRSDKPWYEYRLTEQAQAIVPAWVTIARWAETHLEPPELGGMPSFTVPAARRPRRFLPATCANNPSSPKTWSLTGMTIRSRTSSASDLESSPPAQDTSQIPHDPARTAGVRRCAGARSALTGRGCCDARSATVVMALCRSGRVGAAKPMISPYVVGWVWW